MLRSSLGPDSQISTLLFSANLTGYAPGESPVMAASFDVVYLLEGVTAELLAVTHLPLPLMDGHPLLCLLKTPSWLSSVLASFVPFLCYLGSSLLNYDAMMPPHPANRVGLLWRSFQSRFVMGHSLIGAAPLLCLGVGTHAGVVR